MVFLQQEILSGASLVVWAIRDGRDAAIQIENIYNQKKIKILKQLKMNIYKKNKLLLEKTHNYKSDMEHDACGVGLIASTNGKKTRKVVEYGIEALKLFGIGEQLMLMVNLEMEQVSKLKLLLNFLSKKF